MKVCEICGKEIATLDGFNQCLQCEEPSKVPAGSRAAKTRARAKRNRQGRDQVMRDMGLVKVRGAMGGVYWE